MAHITHPESHHLHKCVSGVTYSYAFITPSQKSQTSSSTTTFTNRNASETIILPMLFLHGFPSSIHDFRHQITHFRSSRAVFAPDMLGYGLTGLDASNPKADAPPLSAYKSRTVVNDLIELLNLHSLEKVHVVAHDVGCKILSKLLNYAPSRVASATFLCVPYAKPAESFDLEMVNKLTKDAMGVERFGYIRFFVGQGEENRDPAALMEKRQESFQSVMYSEGEERMGKFYPRDKLREWLEGDERAVRSAYITAQEEETRLKIFGECGYEGALRWYEAMTENIDVEDEKAGIENGKVRTTVECPVLGIEPAQGKWNMPGFMEGGLKGVCKGEVRVEQVPTTGHWVQIESAARVNGMIEEFLGQVEKN